MGEGISKTIAAISLAATCFRGDPPPASATGACIGQACGNPAPSDARCVLPSPTNARTFAVRFDALGYLPGTEVWAVVLGHGEAAPKYDVYDLRTGCAVGAGVAAPRLLDRKSLAGPRLTGDRIEVSGVSRPGRYVVRLEDGSQFGPIVVDAAAYADVLPKLVRFLDTQKCGPTTAQVSQHRACHLHASTRGAHSGDAIAVADGHRGRVDVSSGPVVDVEGGWHDAGDYIKFVGTTAFTLAVDLLALRDHGDALASPRAGAVRDGLRGEMRWGLDWLARMLGGPEMYHQVSGEKDHDVGWRSPDDDTRSPIPRYDQRPAFRFSPRAGANLLGRSAAALALGAHVFADDAAYASKLLALARAVYAAAVARPLVQNPVPADFYRESSVDDDLAFGAAVLARVTGEATFREDALSRARAITTSDSSPSPLSWGDVRALALLETALAFPSASGERAEMAKALAALAAPILSASADPSAPASAFRYALSELGDGSIEQSLGAAAVCLASMRLGGARACAEVARAQLHWLFGQNPFGIAFMVGVGAAFPVRIHHSLAQAARLTLVGAVVGGPASMKLLRERRSSDRSLKLPTSASPFAAWSTEEVAYDDAEECYVVNEPAIDFTAPLVFVVAELLDLPM